ncbi:MAG TPA: hypothetical protein VF939_03805 [Puia sp.]
MKNVFLLAAACGLFLLSACRKGMEPNHEFPNPLRSNNQVVEYHKTFYDALFNTHVPYLFIKKYDPSGRAVTEIDCSFEDDRGPTTFYSTVYHEFKVSQQGRMIYLINKQLPKSNIPDTVARVTLNEDGRAESCAVNPELALDFIAPTWITQHYIYRNDKVIAVKSEYNTPDYPYYYPRTDSLHYDNYGNLLSFNGNTFQYDYTRTARQQFYCEDLTGQEEPFYLLEYLGFFPEVSSPTNVMIHYDNAVDRYALTNHKFDREGRLISYDYHFGPTTITWK